MGRAGGRACRGRAWGVAVRHFRHRFQENERVVLCRDPRQPELTGLLHKKTPRSGSGHEGQRADSDVSLRARGVREFGSRPHRATTRIPCQPEVSAVSALGRAVRGVDTASNLVASGSSAREVQANRAVPRGKMSLRPIPAAIFSAALVTLMLVTTACSGSQDSTGGKDGSSGSSGSADASGQKRCWTTAPPPRGSTP